METWAQHWCVGAGVECCRAQLPAQLLYQAVDVAWPRLCQVQPPCLSSLGLILACTTHRQVALLDLSGKDGGLRLRAANMLGLLIRHASSISPRLVEAGAFCSAAHALQLR